MANSNSIEWSSHTTCWPSTTSSFLPAAPDPLGWYNNWWHIEVENPNQSGLISEVQMIHFISPLKTKTKMSTTNGKLNNYSKLHLEMVKFRLSIMQKVISMRCAVSNKLTQSIFPGNAQTIKAIIITSTPFTHSNNSNSSTLHND